MCSSHAGGRLSPVSYGAEHARVPDYVTLDLSFFWPIGPIPAGPGGGAVFTLTRHGDLFAGPQGGVGAAGPSAAVRAGWLLQTDTTACDINNFVGGWGVTGSGGIGPVSVGATYGFTGVPAVEAGVGTPGASITPAYLWHVADLW